MTRSKLTLQYAVSKCVVYWAAHFGPMRQCPPTIAWKLMSSTVTSVNGSLQLDSDRQRPTATREIAHHANTRHAEHRGCQHDRGYQNSDSQPCAIDVEQGADAWLPLGEEHVTDDRADHHQAGAGAHSGHDRRKGRPQF